MKEIAHLHCHSEFSILKGVGDVDSWYEKAAKRGIKALAFTELGNMGSALASYLAAQKTKGVKCIFGLQALTVQDVRGSVQEEPIVLLAKNEKGYKNLLKLSKFSWTKGYDTRRLTPRVDFEALHKYRKGVIALTGSLSGPVAVAFQVDFDTARQALKQLQDIYGKNLYAEIQLTEVQGQKSYNKSLMTIADELGVECVVTNDCHFISRDDFTLKETLVKIADSVRNKMHLPEGEVSSQKYLKTYKQLNIIRQKLHGYVTQSAFDKMVDTANDIAKSCKVEIPIGHHSLPKYDVPSHPMYKKGMDALALYRHIAEEGFKRKVVNDKYRKNSVKEYRKQFDFEMKVISDAGFVDYFLIVQDIILWAKNNDIEVGAARGSVAGSLVAFCMDITDIDPIKFDLMFERFLNPTRISGERAKSADALPDIDIDFERTRRPDVKRYIIAKYGADSVCTIGSYQTMKIKSLMRDLFKVFDGQFPVDEDKTAECTMKEINILCKHLDDNKITTLEKALKDDEFKKFRKKYTRFIDVYCMGLEEQVRAVSRHAAGVLVTPTKLTDWIPVRTQKVEGEDDRVLVSQWEDIYCERRGLLKLDILGIKMLDVFKYARWLIKRRHGVTVDIREMEGILDDRKVLRKFGNGETHGVFQYNSDLQSHFLREIKNVTFEDLITTNAALRPGPMDAGAHRTLIKLKHGEEKPHYDHKILRQYLRKTYGLYIYQEDVMRTAHVLGGLTLAQADIMRSAIKKKDSTMIEAFKANFVKGCVEKGLTEEHGAEVWGKLLAFSTYGFNRSHSASYAYLGFFCQWLKVYYPVEFWTAALEFASDDEKSPENVWKFRTPIMNEGIEILPPRANLKLARFYVTIKGKITWPIKAIKGIGIKAAEGIAQACAENKPKTFKDFYDCVPKRAANKRVFDRMMAAGAFNNYGEQFDIVQEYYRIRKMDVPEELAIKKDDSFAWEELRNKTLGYMERSYKDRYSSFFNTKHIVGIEGLESAKENTYLIVGGKLSSVRPWKSRTGKMYFATLSDTDGDINLVILSNFAKKIGEPKVGDIVEVFGRKGYSRRGDVELVLDNKDCEWDVYMEDSDND